MWVEVGLSEKKKKESSIVYIHAVKVLLETSYSIEVWGWGDGSVSEGFAVQAWDLSSVPRTLVKKQGAQACSPHMGQVERGGFLGFSDQSGE